jgi:hypothetical protein
MNNEMSGRFNKYYLLLFYVIFCFCFCFCFCFFYFYFLLLLLLLFSFSFSFSFFFQVICGVKVRGEGRSTYNASQGHLVGPHILFGMIGHSDQLRVSHIRQHHAQGTQHDHRTVHLVIQIETTTLLEKRDGDDVGGTRHADLLGEHVDGVGGETLASVCVDCADSCFEAC